MNRIVRLVQLAVLAQILLFLFFGQILRVWEASEAFLREKFGGNPSAEAGGRGSSVSAMEAGALLSLASGVKPAIVDFYQANNRLPRPGNSRDIGLPPGSRLLENGSLEVRADGVPEARVYWRFSPTASGEARWECVTPDIRNLAEHMPDCRYDPSFRKDDPIVQEYALTDHLYFESGKSDEDGLMGGEQDRFERILQAAAPHPNNQVTDVQVSGYADPMGSSEDNDRLAESRAVYVRKSLVAIGIERSLIGLRVVGVDPGAPPDCSGYRRKERVQCLARSRRVDFVIKARRTL
jgi:outer membrane protein OmpA-like peptidoglycan-associated protein